MLRVTLVLCCPVSSPMVHALIFCVATDGDDSWSGLHPAFWVDRFRVGELTTLRAEPAGIEAQIHDSTSLHSGSRTWYPGLVIKGPCMRSRSGELPT